MVLFKSAPNCKIFLQSVRFDKDKYKKTLSYGECKEIFRLTNLANLTLQSMSQGLKLINKSGLIQLVLNSSKPEASTLNDLGVVVPLLYCCLFRATIVCVNWATVYPENQNSGKFSLGVGHFPLQYIGIC